MKPSDFRAKITYRNNSSKSSSINVNGIKVSQITTADSTLPGYSYAHSFLVDSLTDSNLMSSEGEFIFTLNLKNVEADNFPSGFLIEFFNKVDPEKIIPYKYTEFYTIKKAESINITLSSSDANLADKDKNLYILKPTFKITSNYDFEKSEKEKIAKAISVSNIDSSKVSKVWKDKTLTLSFKENLQQNTSYTISIGDVNNKEGFIITTFNNFNFTTKPELYNIEYDYNGGKTAVPNPESYDLTTTEFTLNNPTKEGYDFIGWEGTGITSGTASMAVIIPKGSEGDRTYAASFTQRFSIAYTLNGGSVAAANPVSYNKYSANIMLNNPTKADYDFLGWTGTNIPEGTASKSVVIYTGSEGNRQYVASFTERYTITYNLSDGTSSNPLSYNKYTNSFTLTTPTRTSDTSSDFYVFIGWTGTDIASVTKTVTIPQGSTGNREFTAHWLEGKSFELSPGISLKMIKCPAGTFIMGSPEGELDHSVNESQHQVTLTQDYYIGIYEVTQIQYFTAMNTNPSNFKDGLATEAPTTSANHPVETVKWSDAKNFCTWLNTNITSGVPADYHFDLPTEAQWEYACRANTTTSLNNGTNIAYSTGFDPNLIEVAWCKTNSATSTQLVGGKKPNNWGLYDMHGNVNEWCLDLRDSDWTIDYLPDPVTDPYYTTGTEYIIRGGCFNSGENKRYRSAARDGKTTTSKFSNVGFRVVLTHD